MAVSPSKRSLKIKLSCPVLPVIAGWLEDIDALEDKPSDPARDCLRISSQDAKPSEFCDEMPPTILLGPLMLTFDVNTVPRLVCWSLRLPGNT